MRPIYKITYGQLPHLLTIKRFDVIDLTVTLILGLLARVNVNNVSTDTRMLQRIIVRTQISTTTFVLALFYATKVSRRHEKSLADVLIPALIVADKFLYDGTYTTKDWVEFTNHKYSVAELNSLERGFLNTLGYNLFITEKDYDRFLAYLDLMLWYRQIRMIGLLRWKSLSYCDIGKLDLRSCLGIGSLMGPLEVVSLMAKIVLNLFSWYISVLLFCGLTIYGLTVFKPAIAPANDLN